MRGQRDAVPAALEVGRQVHGTSGKDVGGELAEGDLPAIDVESGLPADFNHGPPDLAAGQLEFPSEVPLKGLLHDPYRVDLDDVVGRPFDGDPETVRVRHLNEERQRLPARAFQLLCILAEVPATPDHGAPSVLPEAQGPLAVGRGLLDPKLDRVPAWPETQTLTSGFAVLEVAPAQDHLVAAGAEALGVVRDLWLYGLRR